MKFKNIRLQLVSIIFCFLGTPIISIAQSAQIPKEEIWLQAKEFTGFNTYLPEIGLDASEKTKVLLTYDSLNIYVKAFCYDNEPEKILANLTSRDNLQNDDSFTFEIDLDGASTTNFFFRVNPLGVQEDGLINQDDDEDLNPDKIWFSQGLITEEGYEVILKIPFKSLRFKWQKEISFNIGFKRNIFRKSELDVFPPFNSQISNRLLQRETLVFSGVKKNKIFKLIPELTYTNRNELNEGSWNQTANKFDFGITSKVGITSDLVLDLTYNPDFSQIESDAGQVDINLRNPLYLSEKRPFFQEGTEHFSVGGANFYQTPINTFVHTRNIIDPIYGLKLSGKLGEKVTIASMVSTDESEDIDTHFKVFRIKKNFKDDNYLGFIYTGTDNKTDYNNVLGFDGAIRINGQHRIEFNVIKSATKTDVSNERIGNSFGAFYEFKNKLHEIRLGVYSTDTSFATRIGYANRVGIQDFPITYNLLIPMKSNFLTQLRYFLYIHPRKDLYSNKFEHWILTGIRFSLKNESWIRFVKLFAEENYCFKKFKRNQIITVYSFQFNKYLSLSGRLAYGDKIYYDPMNPYQGYGFQTRQTLEYTPNSQFRIKLTASMSDFYKKSTKELIYNYKIVDLSTSYQLNKSLFIRVLGEYNFYTEKLNSEFLLSFTYIPGTVLQLGYNLRAEKDLLNPYGERNPDLRVNNKSIFFKASYVF